MAITAEDIQNQSFNVDRRGYDVDEVDVFLEHVAAEIDIMNAHIAELEQYNNQYEDEEYMDMDAAFAEPALPTETSQEELEEKDARIAELEKLLEDKNDESSAIAAALVSAQRTAREIIEKAEDEAADIRADAKADAEAIINKAEATRERIEFEIAELDNIHDDTCDAYAEALREFIDDANSKLDNIERAKGKVKPSSAMGHARFASPSQAPFHQPQPGVAPSYSTPVVTNAATVVPATPTPSAVEKDLSGFGDASDFFELDDVD